MKTKPIYAARLILFTGLILSQLISAQDQMKEVKKEFTISKGAKLQIENKFGNIEVMNWDKPVVSITVKISAVTGNAQSSKSLADKINIEFSEPEKNIILARTIINTEGSGNQKSHFNIDYNVYVPAWINLTLDQKFGNIRIQEINGNVIIDLKHGKLQATTLSGNGERPYNKIIMAYSDGVIDETGSADLEMAFSKVNIEEADNISADSKYSGINISKCSSFSFDSKYDNFTVDDVKNVTGTLDYSNLRVGSLSGKMETDGSYSTLKLEQVLPSFELIRINSLRGASKIGIHPDISLDVYANVKRGDIRLEGFTVLEKKIEGPDKYIHAINGVEGTGKIIELDVQEGAANLYKY